MNQKLVKLDRSIFEPRLKESEEFLNSLPWDNSEFYANFLAQTYYFVSHSTRLLARSISHFKVDRELLYKRFVSHLKEEDYHEKIALKDLQGLDFHIENFPELSYTKAFYEPQYYKIDESKGTDLLGYILYLEAIAVHSFKQVYNIIEKKYGAKACKFIHVHINEDPDHLEHAMAMIEGLDDEQQRRIWDNFEQSARMYIQMLRGTEKTVNISSQAA